jgi:hypothetical protein
MIWLNSPSLDNALFVILLLQSNCARKISIVGTMNPKLLTCLMCSMGTTTC